MSLKRTNATIESAAGYDMTVQSAQNELLDISGDQGGPPGLQPRCFVPSRDLWPRSIKVVVFSSTEQMLLWRHRLSKDVRPRIWDLGIAVRQRPGDALIDGADRDLMEKSALFPLEIIPQGHELEKKRELTEQGSFNFDVQRPFVSVSDESPALSDRKEADVQPAEPGKIADLRSRPFAELTPWFRSWLDVITNRRLLPEELFGESHISPGSGR
jgi:hypothetical protein